MGIFSVIFMFFLFYKAKGNSRHPLCKPGLSKHFLKTKIKLASLRHKFLFPKNHDIFNLTILIVTVKRISKISLREKELFELLEYILNEMQLLLLKQLKFKSEFSFFFIRKFCVKRGCKDMAIDALTLKKLKI